MAIKKSNLLDNQFATYFLIGLLIIGAFIIGNLWTRVQYLQDTATNQPSNPSVAAVPASPAPTPKITAGDIDPITQDDFVRGNRSSRIALIEYSDLECPFCKRFHETAKQIVKDYDGKVMWVYRQFPLSQLHSKAPNEALAAECAGSLGGQEGFWNFVDIVYDNTPSNNGLDPAKLPEFAGQIGLNVTDFNNCIQSGELSANVDADYQSGIKAGVSGTPGNILLDTKTNSIQIIPGAVPYDQIKPVIDKMLAS
jgi:protein-disulfide isomerase